MACSAWCAWCSVEEVAQPDITRAAIAAATGPRGRMGSASRVGIDDIGASRDLELEHLVGEAGVLSVVRERERRTSPLVGCCKAADLQRRTVDDDYQPVVVALLLPRIEP